MAGTYFLPQTLMAMKTGPSAEFEGTEGTMLVVDTKAGTTEQHDWTADVAADNGVIMNQTRDAVGRRIVTIGNQQFSDDGENLQQTGRRSGSAYKQPTDYGA